jgi:hypothetical protein
MHTGSFEESGLFTAFSLGVNRFGAERVPLLHKALLPALASFGLFLPGIGAFVTDSRYCIEVENLVRERVQAGRRERGEVVAMLTGGVADRGSCYPKR